MNPVPPLPRREGERFGLTESCILAVAFFMVAISWSPLLPGLLGIPFSAALFVAFVVHFTLTTARYGTSRLALGFCVFWLCASALMMVLSDSVILLTRTAPIALLVFSAYQTCRIPGMAERLCKVLTIFLQIGVVCAAIGMVYAFAGGQPLLTITNVDGRENSLYLTTMSNFVFLGIIRPSFIYDEPGAFSFLICAVVALREILRMSRGPSLMMLVLGILTFSITHMIILLLFLVTRYGALRTAIVLAAVLVPLVPRFQGLEELAFITDRFSVVDGDFSGDNRSDQLTNFARIANPTIFAFGDIECQWHVDKTCEAHGDISSSPVTPVYKGGLLALLTQIAVHVGLIVAFFRRKTFRFGALAMSLLLLQRPYFEIAGYGFLTYLIVFLMFDIRKAALMKRAPEADDPNVLQHRPS